MSYITFSDVSTVDGLPDGSSSDNTRQLMSVIFLTSTSAGYWEFRLEIKKRTAQDSESNYAIHLRPVSFLVIRRTYKPEETVDLSWRGVVHFPKDND